MIVIGAGLGGLCLAKGLRRAGISVAVYERDVSPAAPAQGHRLHIDENGRRALAACLPPNLFALLGALADRPAARVNGFDEHLRPAGVFELARNPAAEDVMPAHVVIDRRVVRRILLDGLDEVVQFDRRRVGHDSTGDGLLRRRRDRARHGAGRRGRGRVGDPASAAPPRPRGRLRHAVDLRPGSPDTPAAQRVADGELLAASGGRLREIVLGQIAGWHPLIRHIVGGWDTSTLYPITVRGSVPVSPWESSNVTLLGDAVHAMSPAAGAGANMALRDAAALSAALAKAAAGAPLIDVMNDYERDMIAEGFDAVKRSSANGVRILGEDPLPW